MEFVHCFLPWETDLLQQHELYVDPYTAHLELIRHFFAGSDGSEKYGNQGAFSWVISSYLGKRDAVGIGPSCRSVMDSYQAKVHRHPIHFEVPHSSRTIYTEDARPLARGDRNRQQFLLDKILHPLGNHLSNIAVKPINELTPEWDLLNEIQKGLHLLPGVSLTHVKGHQGDNKTYDSLSLLAQLNVDAYKMAGSIKMHMVSPTPSC